MKKLCSVTLFLTFVGFLSTAALNQTQRKSEVKRIDAYCKAVDVFVEKSRGPDLIFADVSGEQQEKPIWRKFAAEASLEKFRETGETYNIAFNWRRNRRIAASNFTLFSESGDWAKYVNHCFRADGSLARVTSELRTFYGDFLILQNLYFSKTGKLLKKNMETMDLVTHKPKKPDKDFLDDNSYLVNNVDYFMNTNKLPFARFFQKNQK